MDLERDELGFFFLLILDLTVDKPWVNEDIEAVEGAGLKMENKLPFAGVGLRPLVERVLSEIRPMELEQELKFLVVWGLR
jgi:hypothetical protein